MLRGSMGCLYRFTEQRLPLYMSLIAYVNFAKKCEKDETQGETGGRQWDCSL